MAKSSSKLTRLTLVAGATLALGGCTQLDNAIASVPYLAMMRNAPSFDPYEAPLNAPPGSIPFESPGGPHMPDTPPTEEGLNAFAATPQGRNPFNDKDPAVLALGQKMFERNCAVCHGADAKGKGSVLGPDKYMGVPPDITMTGRSEGYVYAIIRAGRGMMPSYGARVNHTERWAIASYVAHLQAQGGHAAPAAGATAPANGATAPSTTGATSGAAPATTTDSMPPAAQENR